MSNTSYEFTEKFRNVGYKVIKKADFKPIKLSIDIILEKKVDEEFLKAFAKKLRQDEPAKYERIFICHYLPCMVIDSGAWAITHFDNNLKVEIQGLTIEQEQTLLRQSESSFSGIVGEWLDETPFVSAKYTILDKYGKILLIIRFKDGKSLKMEMLQENIHGEIKYYKDCENDHEEYYIINKEGCLSVYDNGGLIRTIQPIK